MKKLLLILLLVMFILTGCQTKCGYKLSATNKNDDNKTITTYWEKTSGSVMFCNNTEHINFKIKEQQKICDIIK